MQMKQLDVEFFYLEIFRVIHFFVCTLSWTVIWNLIALMWRQRFTRTLIFIDNWYNGDGLENSFCPPASAGVQLKTGTRRPPVDTEPLLLRAHWLHVRTIQCCLCVIAEWNCSAQQLCVCFQKDIGAGYVRGKVFIPERLKHTGLDWRTRQWLRVVMVCESNSCSLREITLQSINQLINQSIN